MSRHNSYTSTSNKFDALNPKHDENEDNTKSELLEEYHQDINTIQQANDINIPHSENTNTTAVHQPAAGLPSTGHKANDLSSATQLTDNQATAHKDTVNHSATQQQVVNPPADYPPIVIQPEITPKYPPRNNSTNLHSTPTANEYTAETIILCDSNGCFLNTELLCPGSSCQYIRRPTILNAKEIIKHSKFIIHSPNPKH